MNRARLLRPVAVALATLLVPILGAAAYFALGALSRDRVAIVAGTAHPQLSRESCVECHAPIAAEWRESFHRRSVNGPFWERVRDRGYADVLGALRVPCMNCHAPANVLDLPNGAHPVERIEGAGMGVDCVSCHVSRRGITGPGRSTAAPHEVIGDERFSSPVLASTQICARCHEEDMDHAKTVSAWQQTPFARDGITCLHCHMPEVEAPLLMGGAPRKRRSHRFPGDKDEAMLRSALNASLEVTRDRRAVVSNRERSGGPPASRLGNEPALRQDPGPGRAWRSRGRGGALLRGQGAHPWISRLLALPGGHRDPARREPRDRARATRRSRQRLRRADRSFSAYAVRSATSCG